MICYGLVIEMQRPDGNTGQKIRNRHVYTVVCTRSKTWSVVGCANYLYVSSESH